MHESGATGSVEQSLASRSEEEVARALDAAEVSEYAQGEILAMLRIAKEAGLSVKGLAVQIGTSPGVISQLLSARYAGNYDLRSRKIEQWRQRREKRAIFGGRDEFVETEVARSLWTMFERTRYSRRIQVIQSEEQLGKSTAAREYTHRNNGGRTVMVTLKPGGGSNPLGVFLRDLAHAARVHNTSDRKIIDLRYDIRDALSICDLVIIDEVHQIASWRDKWILDLLEYLRIEVHEDGKRGICLIATNSDVMATLDLIRRRSRYNLGQLMGRMCNQVLELYCDEIPEGDVRALVERYYKPRKATLEKLYDIAIRPKLGHYGLLLDIMNRAWTDCKISGCELTDELVMKIAQETMEDIGSTQRRRLYETVQ
jgi:hypothetical protein